jgi:hypothetical protein
VQNIRWFAQHALGLQDRPIDTEQAHHRVRHDPAGVVVIITPWNAPLMLSTWKLGPALAAGNTCILKPPEWAPLTCSLLADAAHAAGLPPGVFNVVQGTGATTGAQLVADARSLGALGYTVVDVRGGGAHGDHVRGGDDTSEDLDGDQEGRRRPQRHRRAHQAAQDRCADEQRLAPDRVAQPAELRRDQDVKEGGDGAELA